MRDVAKMLKLGVKAVDALVREAIAEKVTKVKAIVKKVRERLAALAKIKCEDVISAAVSKERHIVTALL